MAARARLDRIAVREIFDLPGEAPSKLYGDDMDEESENVVDQESWTVGDLKRELDGLSDDTKLSFAGGLSFFYLKRQSDDACIFEFNEAQARLSDAFKQKNPHVKVAFIDAGTVEWGESGVTGSSAEVEVQ